MWLDRYEPEPRSLLVLGLGWGAFVATSGALLLQLFDSVVFANTDAFTATVVAPMTEEAAKGLFILLLLVFRRHELDGVLDGLVYAGMVGIGFAFTENILYLTSAYMGEDGQAGGVGGAVGLFIVRVPLRPVRAPLLHRLHRHRRSASPWAPAAGRSACSAPLVGYVVAVLRPRRLERLADARRRPQRDRDVRLLDGAGLPAARAGSPSGPGSGSGRS